MNGTPTPIVDKFYGYAVEFILLPLAILLLPIRGFVVTVVLFVFIDTLTGVWKSMRNKDKVFSSRGLSELIPKSILYATLILAFYFIDLYIVNTTIWGQEYLVTKAMTLILLGIEIKSIDENLEAIFGIGIFEGLSNLFKAARSIMSRVKEVKDDANKIGLKK